MEKTRSFWDKCLKDKKGTVVLWQNPNVPLWTWLAATALGMLIKSGKPHILIDAIAFGSLFAWAYLEIRFGVNYFRRALGTLVLIATLAGRLK